MSYSVLFVQHEELALYSVISVPFIRVFRLHWTRFMPIYRQGLMPQITHQASLELFHKFSNFSTVLASIYIAFTCCNRRNSNLFFVAALRKIWQACKFYHYTKDRRSNICSIQKVSRSFTSTGIATNNIMRRKTKIISHYFNLDTLLRGRWHYFLS